MNCTQNHRKNTRDTEFFYLNSVIFLKRGNIIPVIATYQIIKIVYDWGKKLRIEHYGKIIDICNRKN